MHLNFAAVKVWFNEKIKYESEILPAFLAMWAMTGIRGGASRRKSCRCAPENVKNNR